MGDACGKGGFRFLYGSGKAGMAVHRLHDARNSVFIVAADSAYGQSYCIFVSFAGSFQYLVHMPVCNRIHTQSVLVVTCRSGSDAQCGEADMADIVGHQYDLVVWMDMSPRTATYEEPHKNAQMVVLSDCSDTDSGCIYDGAEQGGKL